jgi:ubiquitin-conjugating enzyme E2 J2
MSNITNISAQTEKRLSNEIKDLIKNKIDFIQAVQDETNRFIFYFLLKGDSTSDYKDGYYLGKILLPNDYPTKPGDFMILTPNGRFTPDSKICLTNTGYHAESWTPLWTISNVLKGIASIWLDDNEHGISHIKDTPMNRKKYAKESMAYNMKYYPEITVKFDQFISEDGTVLSEEKQKIALLPKKKEPKEVKAEFKDEVKVEPKEELKHTVKVEPKEEPKHTVKVEPKEELKHTVGVEPKEELKHTVEVEPKEELKHTVEIEPKEEPKHTVKIKPKEEKKQKVNVKSKEKSINKQKKDNKITDRDKFIENINLMKNMTIANFDLKLCEDILSYFSQPCLHDI